MKKLVVTIIAFLFVLVGCTNEMDSPTKKVETFLNKYQKQDEEIIKEFDVSMIEEETLNDEQKEKYKDIMLDQYKNLVYEIKEEKVDGNKATVEVEIEVYDYNKALENAYTYLDEHQDDFLIDDVLDTVSFINYKLEQLMDYKDRVKYTITFNLSRKDTNSEWELEKLSETDLKKIHGIYKNQTNILVFFYLIKYILCYN